MLPEDQIYIENAILKANKPPWGLYIATVSIGLTVIGSLYTLIIYPINTRLDKIDKILEENNKRIIMELREQGEVTKRLHDLPRRP